MAKYIGLSERAPDSERKLSEALRMLPDPWTILHGVSWQSLRDGREGDGEADFVLVHPSKGGIVIEVKGGGVDVVDGRWSSRNRLGKTKAIKNPFDQAVDSKHTLIRWLSDKGIKGFGLGHAVCFPDLREVPDLGPAASRAIVWTSFDLANPVAAVERVLRHWSTSSKITGSDFRVLVSSLAPTVTVRRRLSTVSAEAESALLTFTAEQVEIFAALRAKRSALVLGGAGTGKTMLAMARARQLADDGFRTLLVCYNELLGSELRIRYGTHERLTASNFHSLCLEKASQAKLDERPDGSDAWWERRAPELLVEACSRLGPTYDAIVVDEAQDFAPSWIAALRCLSTNEAASPFFVFADPKQELWARDWLREDDWGFEYELRENMRNTRQIAERVNAVLKLPLGTRGVHGPAPHWREVAEPKRRDRDVRAVIEDLVDEGFGPHNLVVLAQNFAATERLRDGVIGPWSLGRWGSRGIPVETISRFKGMESEAVVLCLEQADDELERTLAYVGMSRARSVLIVVAPPKLKSVLNWVQPVQR